MAYLGPRWESFELRRSAEAAVILQLVLHFVLQKDELKATPVTVEGLIHLPNR